MTIDQVPRTDAPPKHQEPAAGEVPLAGGQPRPSKRRRSFFRNSIRPRQLLLIDAVRYVLCAARAFWFVTVRRHLRIVDFLPADVSRNTVMHNIKGVRDYDVSRSHLLIRPLVSIDRVRHGIRTKKVLTVGPRAEGEIYNLIGYGFSGSNIRGLDLISYSPYVDLGDMHAMPYEGGSFDIVILGWVIAYSENNQRVADEVLRVARNGSVIAIAPSRPSMDDDQLIATYDYRAGSVNRLRTVRELLDLFQGYVGQVYFSQDPEEDLFRHSTKIVAIFSIRK